MTGSVPPGLGTLPSSTALRMGVLAVALVVSALFVGTALHNTLLGAAWDADIARCLAPGQILPDSPAQLACQAPAEQRRAAISLAVSALVVLLAVAVTMIAPTVIRRRRRLVPADGRFEPAVTALTRIAAAAGVRRPGVLIGPGSVREPFCLGRPGRHHVVLPRKLALYGNPPLFEALVTHEVAHLVHRDVAVSWLGRSLFHVLGPLLALPVVVALVGGEPRLALDIAWRAAVLLGVVMLVVRGLMRAREFDADLRVARDPRGGSVLDEALARRERSRPAAVPRTARWAAWLHSGWHPSPARRRLVLAHPFEAARVDVTDGLSLGFLVTAAAPILANTISAMLLGSPTAAFVGPITACVLGPLVGAALGLALWRDAIAVRDTSRTSGTAAAALGVLLGGLAGQVAGLALVAVDGLTPLLVLTPVGLAGATVLVGGLGELWAPSAGRGSRPIATWGPAVVVGALIATAALLASTSAATASGGGLPLLIAWSTSSGTGTPLAPIAVLVALVAAWALYRSRGSALPSVGVVVAVGLLAGLAGGTVLVLHRVTAGAATTDADTLARVDATVLGAGALGAGVVVVLALVRRVAGAACGLLAGWLAATTTAATLLALVAATGGDPGPAAPHVLGGAMAVGLVLALPVSLVGALPLPVIRSRAIALATAAVLALVVAVGVVAGTMSTRTELLGGSASVTEGPPVQSSDLVVPRDLYFDVVARPLLEGKVDAVTWWRLVQAERPPNAVAAQRIRDEQMPLLRQLQATAMSVRSDDPEVSRIHAAAVDGTQLYVEGFSMVADGLERNDRETVQSGSAALSRGNDAWARWADGVAAL